MLNADQIGFQHGFDGKIFWGIGAADYVGMLINMLPNSLAELDILRYLEWPQALAASKHRPMLARNSS